MKTFIIYPFFLLLALTSCDTIESFNGNSNSNPNSNQNPDWLVPISEVFDGGPGKDGIPALELPGKFDVDDSRNNYLSDADLVLGFRDGSDICAYPHPILDWHEIINDKVGNKELVVTYCPLTGTGIAWDRELGREVTTFGVSGLLYNSNLIPYDRKTGSNWSQIRLDCINGDLIGTSAVTLQLVEIPWGTWKNMYPDSRVVGNSTGYDRNYGVYPYRNYKTESNLIFDAKPSDDRLHNKERVLGVLIGNEVKVYRFSSFGESLSIIRDRFKDSDLLVIGRNNDFMVAYKPEIAAGIRLEFTPLQDKGEVIMEDQEGNKWNVFGQAVSGPRQGAQLVKVKSFMGYWFSFAAFYPAPEIY